MKLPDKFLEFVEREVAQIMVFGVYSLGLPQKHQKELQKFVNPLLLIRVQIQNVLLQVSLFHEHLLCLLLLTIAHVILKDLALRRLSLHC